MRIKWISWICFSKSAPNKAAIPYGYDGKSVPTNTRREDDENRKGEKEEEEEDLYENSDTEFGEQNPSDSSKATCQT